MRALTKWLAAGTIAAALIGPVAANAASFGFGGEQYPKVGKPALFDPAADHSADTGFLWVNAPDGAKGVKKVVIPFFQVQFVTESDASAMARGGATSDTLMMLKGPTPEQMQAMTDALYDNLVTQLQAAGLEVVGIDQAKTYPAYAAIMADAKPSGAEVKGMGKVTSSFYAPHGMGFYLLPTTLPEYSGGGNFAVMGNQGNVRHEGELLDQSGAAVLGFRAVVDFAKMKSSDNTFDGHNHIFIWTGGKAGVAVPPISTQMFLLTPAAKGTMMDPQNRMRIEVQQPLMIDSGAITSVDNSTTGGQKLGSVAGSVFGVMSGTGLHITQQYDVNVDPKVWQTDVQGAIAGVEAAMVGKLKAGL